MNAWNLGVGLGVPSSPELDARISCRKYPQLDHGNL